MPLVTSQPTGGITSSLDAGAVTAPLINQMIADSGPLGAGNNQPASYIVTTNTFQTGTVDANGANLLLNIGGTNTAGIISGGLTIGKLQSGSVFSQQRFRVSVQNGQHVYICVGSTNAGASAVYNASMSLSKAANSYSDV